MSVQNSQEFCPEECEGGSANNYDVYFVHHTLHARLVEVVRNCNLLLTLSNPWDYV